mmetsp:Transcript_46228/g.118027  ORF Transcript_46228/g.118027 Transcript_46228/m.118027 type:complete len:285 (-) Transcript_46228:1863-2717(-)
MLLLVGCHLLVRRHVYILGLAVSVAVQDSLHRHRQLLWLWHAFFRCALGCFRKGRLFLQCRLLLSLGHDLPLDHIRGGHCAGDEHRRVRAAPVRKVRHDGRQVLVLRGRVLQHKVQAPRRPPAALLLALLAVREAPDGVVRLLCRVGGHRGRVLCRCWGLRVFPPPHGGQSLGGVHFHVDQRGQHVGLRLLHLVPHVLHQLLRADVDALAAAVRDVDRPPALSPLHCQRLQPIGAGVKGMVDVVQPPACRQGIAKATRKRHDLLRGGGAQRAPLGGINSAQREE